MPLLPSLSAPAQSRDVTDTFAGYNHRLKIAPGEFYDTRNLSTRDYPMLATRRKRCTVQQLKNPGGILGKEALCVVDDGVLYYNGEPTPLTKLDRRTEKQMISFGSYVVIWPDKVYYNTIDPEDHGKLEAEYFSNGSVTYEICTLTGDVINYTASEEPPENPEHLQWWYDKAHKSLKQYSGLDSTWTSVATVYTRIKFDSCGTIPKLFKLYDGVTISGTPYPEELEGSKCIYAIGGSKEKQEQDYIIVVGLIESSVTTTDSCRIERRAPDLDYICECQNRLWGCKYGFTEEHGVLNEIYCCALGDFRNWRQYQSLSTDSWTASVGTDGPWTGAINFLGYPTFFKENHIHRVTVSSVGAHKITETSCRGVMAGCSKSLAIVNETLLYKSRTDVCAYQGGFPESVSAALGDGRYSDAVAGSFGSSYYVSMKDETGRPNLFVYDTKNNLWIREDELKVLQFAAAGDGLFAIDADTGILLDINGSTGTEEKYLDWTAQTGILYYQYPDKKYVSRYDIRVSAEQGSKMQIEIQYDSDGVWRYSGKLFFKGLNTITFPVRPRRCDHMEIRLSGNGPVKIYSISRIMEQGSDV